MKIQKLTQDEIQMVEKTVGLWQKTPDTLWAEIYDPSDQIIFREDDNIGLVSGMKFRVERKPDGMMVFALPGTNGYPEYSLMPLPLTDGELSVGAVLALMVDEVQKIMA